MDSKEVIAQVTERVKETANVKAVFGEPYAATAGLTIIPVAGVRVAGAGVGGTGAGRRRNEPEAASNGTGMGLGLKVTALPLGYIEIKPDATARFVPITDATKIAIGGALATSILMLGIFRATRGMSRRKFMNKSHSRY